MKTRRTYDPEFRVEVRDFAMANPTLSLAQIARDFDVPLGTLHGWMRGRGIVADSAKRLKESSELLEARRRIRILEQENIILNRPLKNSPQNQTTGRGGL